MVRTQHKRAAMPRRLTHRRILFHVHRHRQTSCNCTAALLLLLFPSFPLSLKPGWRTAAYAASPSNRCSRGDTVWGWLSVCAACTMLTKLCRLCLPPQYYEMSYGLNIEMHKQVRKAISTCVHWLQVGGGKRVIALNVLFASVSCCVAGFVLPSSCVICAHAKWLAQKGGTLFIIKLTPGATFPPQK